MCLIVFALHSHPDYPLIVVANRDEFYARPTQSARFWPDHPSVFAGRDLQAADKGTWMGINRHGRFAAVTNFRELDAGEHTAARSRGELPSRFLCHDLALDDYAQAVQDEGLHYKGFNLLLWENHRLAHISNRSASPQLLEPGIYGLSNGALDTPWPKVKHAKAALQDALAKPFSADSLLTILGNRDPANIDALPDTGIGLESELLLSSCFIHSEHYGTRASTVLLIHHSGEITWLEQGWNEAGKAAEKQFLQFTGATVARG